MPFANTKGLETVSGDLVGCADMTGLESLVSCLESRVRFCLEARLGADWLVELSGQNYESVYYCLSGRGNLRAAGTYRSLRAGDVILVPANTSCLLDSAGSDSPALQRVRLGPDHLASDWNAIQLHRVVTAERVTALSIVSVYFSATFGTLMNPFEALVRPWNLSAEAALRSAGQLGRALEGLIGSLLGANAMMELTVKQILIESLRQAAEADDLWLRLAAAVRDPKIARAYAAMLTRPEAPHTVGSLADLVNLSRSAFMARFSQVVGCSPISALRHARMRRAATLLASQGLSIDEVARKVGYRSSSSFSRAFQSIVGQEPHFMRTRLQAPVEEVLWPL